MWYQQGRNRTGLYRQLAEDQGEQCAAMLAFGSQSDWVWMAAVAAAHFGRLALGHTEHSIKGIEAWDEIGRNEKV